MLIIVVGIICSNLLDQQSSVFISCLKKPAAFYLFSEANYAILLELLLFFSSSCNNNLQMYEYVNCCRISPKLYSLDNLFAAATAAANWLLFFFERLVYLQPVFELSAQSLDEELIMKAISLRKTLY